MSFHLQTIMVAIDGQLATVNFDPNRVIFLNVVYAPKAGIPYLRASMPGLTRVATTMGTEQTVGGPGNVSRWDGIYQVDAVWPVDAGSDGCAEMVGQILRLFPRGLTLITSDSLLVRFNTPTPVPIRQDGEAWLRGAVRCPWWCQEYA